MVLPSKNHVTGRVIKYYNELVGPMEQESVLACLSGEILDFKRQSKRTARDTFVC